MTLGWRAGACVAALAGALAALPGQARAQWSEPIPVADSTWGNAWPHAVTDQQGDVLVAWNRVRTDTSPTTSRVVVRLRSHTGTWSRILRISPDDSSTLRGVAVDDDGDGWVVWQNGLVYARRVSHTGQLGPVRQISSAGTASAASVSVDGAGNAIIAWQWWSDTKSNVVSIRHLTSSGALGPVRDLEQDAQGAPATAMSHDGNGLVAWGAGTEVHVIRYFPESGWGQVQAVPSTGISIAVQTNFLQAFLDGRHVGTVLWETTGVAGYAFLYSVRISGPIPDVARKVTTRNDVSSPEQAAMDGRGNIRVAWSTGLYDPLYTRQIRADGSLGPTAVPTRAVGAYRLAQGPSTTGLLFWTGARSDGTAYGRVRSYHLDGTLASTSSPAPEDDATALTWLLKGRYLATYIRAGSYRLVASQGP